MRRLFALLAIGLGTSLAYGPSLLEPVSFVMDTKMLDGIRLRAEARITRPEAH